jgi:uncharacterized Ntn-hydrolase superfamily protein
MTYSICALDPATGELGVAVQTRWFNVGNGVPWVESGVGAVATQSFAEVAHGFNGIRLLREGRTAAEALREVLDGDEGEPTRQVGIVDATGGAAAHTGLRCVRFASHLVVPGVTVQANMMEGASVPAAMLATFLGAEGDLAARLLAALRAAERAGGDVRGRQSAALVVAPGPNAEGAAAPPWARRFDLRVEDDRDPLGELARLLSIARGYEAMGEAETALLAGELDAANVAGERSVAFAPEDDQIVLWSGVGLVLEGRVEEARAAFSRAAAVEPRSGEHLRRFAEAGHLPGGEAVLRALELD